MPGPLREEWVGRVLNVGGVLRTPGFLAIVRRAHLCYVSSILNNYNFTL